jgi:hypothetical protein
MMFFEELAALCPRLGDLVALLCTGLFAATARFALYSKKYGGIMVLFIIR